VLKFVTFIHYIYLKGKSRTDTFSINWYSFLYGLIGFFSFLSIIIVAKYFNYVAGSEGIITIDVLDVSLASIGFIFVYLFKRLEKK